LSTYDHPPLAWWMGWLASQAFGSEAPIVIRLPFLLLFAGTTWQMFRLGQRLFGPEAGFWSALALNCAPVLGVTSASWAVPDAPLMFCLLAGANALSKVLFQKSANSWIWLVAGFWGGLAMLSKYHGVFLFAGTFVFLLLSPAHRRWLRTPWPYLATGLALLVFSPVVIWNIQHHWASFTFQTGRANVSQVRFWMPFLALGAQALFIWPPIWLALAVMALRDARSRIRDDRRRLLYCLGLGPILVFTLVSPWAEGLFFHWAAPGYLMLMPVLGAEIAWRRLYGDQLWQRVAQVSAVGVAVLVLLFSALALVTHVARVLPAPDPFQDLRGWSALHGELESRDLKARGISFVAGVRWHQSGRIDYALKQDWPVTCLCRDARGFGVLAPAASFAGQTGIVLVSLKRAVHDTAELAARFETLERLPDIELFHTAYGVSRMAVFLGRGLRNVTP
jgi:4-amino-4-deoxy-L-arabinose transferase-like glycosyltransferase